MSSYHQSCGERCFVGASQELHPEGLNDQEYSKMTFRSGFGARSASLFYVLISQMHNCDPSVTTFRLESCFRTRRWTICSQASIFISPLLTEKVESRSSSRYLFSILTHAAGCLPGTPAYMSKQIMKGDQIVEVDGQSVNESNLRALLVGCDVPGSLVTIKIRREGKQRTVTLKRGK